jgi:anti-sigma regulatory factor (Ser/Thr protein kinase)
VTGHTASQLVSDLALAAAPTAVGIMRSFVRWRLAQWGLHQLIDDAEMVTSELVTNAVKATRTMDPRPRDSELHNWASWC